MNIDPFFRNNSFLCSVLHAMPLVTLVVDEEVRILFRNKTSATLLGNDDTFILHKCGGEAFN